MGKWHCFQCKQKMIEAESLGSYLEITRLISCLKCPSCGAAYLTEQYAMEVVAPGEEQLEAKLK